MLMLVSGAIIGAGLGASRLLRAVIEATAGADEGEIPTTTVRRGDVSVTVSTRGELQGGRAEDLVVPRSGAAELPIIFLRGTGEIVEAGEVVVEFDASGQDFDLIEALADLTEAEQELIQAEAGARIAQEESGRQRVNAELDLRIAEIGQRGNEFLSAIEVRQNEISLERARNRLRQATMDFEHAGVTSGADIEIRRVAVNEARERAETARRTVGDLTLRAQTSGYVQLAENTSGLSTLYSGMTIPTFQLGDIARPGQVIARIPDMSQWEVNSQIPETDRAFLDVGQEAIVRPKAMPGREFRGRISVLGGSSGTPYFRTFNCRVALDETDPDLRPGMSVDVLITVETLGDVLWVPSQAVFDREGRWFVYRREPTGFITHEVTLIRRTESQAVITGIDEGTTIALARPGETARVGAPEGPMGALPR
jgi:multidrug resistance efflux pump